MMNHTSTNYFDNIKTSRGAIEELEKRSDKVRGHNQNSPPPLIEKHGVP